MRIRVIVLTMLIISFFTTSCHERPKEMYVEDGLLAFKYKGISYIKLIDPKYNHTGWVVDYSQFFQEDTLIVNGYVWVKTTTEKEHNISKIVPQMK